MASDSKSVGAYGEIQIIVTLESQSTGGNSSTFRVRGVMKNNGNTSSFGSASVSISGSSAWSGSASFSCGANGGTDTVVDRTFTETHNSDGYLTATYKFTLGATGTYTFGNGGYVDVSYTAPRIPKKPDTPATPTLKFTAPNTIRVDYDAPDNNGDAIYTYNIQYDDNSSFSSPTNEASGTDMYENISGLGIGKTWWFRINATNSYGTSAYSGSRSYAIPNVPSACPAPTLEFSPATTVKVTWTAPSNGGASITGYDIQYADNSAFTSPKTVTSTSTTVTVTDITVGKTWYFRIRAKNSQGTGAYGASTPVSSYAGPRVRVAGVYKPTVAYVKVAGVWKVAIPYVKVAGVWKVGGG